MRLMIIGAGFSGRAIAERLRGKAEWIGGTSRSSHNFPLLKEAGAEPFLFSGSDLSSDLRGALSRATHLVMSAGPRDTGDPFLACLDEPLADLCPKLEWCCYLSTVGVYGNHDGAWVDEETECRPVSKRSVERVDAENAWMEKANESGIPLAILRLSGIYGPGRNGFINLEKGTARRLVKPGQVFNRIHVADIAGALEFLARGKYAGVFNVTDDEPAPPQDVVAFAAETMGVEPPDEIPFEDADLSPMARSFYGENKRVSNAKIKQLGYRYQYPDYRTAFRAMWQHNCWKS